MLNIVNDKYPTQFPTKAYKSLSDYQKIFFGHIVI